MKPLHVDMKRIIYFIRMLFIQVPMIWRMTAHKKYFYRHYYADNSKSVKLLRFLLKDVDTITKI